MPQHLIPFKLDGVSINDCSYANSTCIKIFTFDLLFQVKLTDATILYCTQSLLYSQMSV